MRKGGSFRASLFECVQVGHISYFHEQADGTHTLKPGRRDVPAAGAFRLPGYFQGDFVPPIRKEGCKALPGVYSYSIQE